MSDAAVYAFGKATLTPIANEAEQQFTLAVCRHETGYGTGWPLGAGAGSNNWGAITAKVDQPHFDHEDSHADGTKFVSHFKTYPSPFHGLTDAAQTILKPNVRAALARGDGAGAVQAMHDNRYFEASVPSYIEAMKRNYAALVKGANLTPALNFDGSSSSGVALLALAALFVFGKGLKV